MRESFSEDRAAIGRSNQTHLCRRHQTRLLLYIAYHTHTHTHTHTHHTLMKLVRQPVDRFRDASHHITSHTYAGRWVHGCSADATCHACVRCAGGTSVLKVGWGNRPFLLPFPFAGAKGDLGIPPHWQVPQTCFPSSVPPRRPCSDSGHVTAPYNHICSP